MFVGGLAIVPAGLVLPGLVLLGGFGLPSHGGLATVVVAPLGRDMLPDAAVELEVAPTPLLVVPVLEVVDGVLPGEVELAEVPVAVVLPVEGVHGATVVVVAP